MLLDATITFYSAFNGRTIIRGGLDSLNSFYGHWALFLQDHGDSGSGGDGDEGDDTDIDERGFEGCVCAREPLFCSIRITWAGDQPVEGLPVNHNNIGNVSTPDVTVRVVPRSFATGCHIRQYVHNVHYREPQGADIVEEETLEEYEHTPAEEGFSDSPAWGIGGFAGLETFREPSLVSDVEEQWDRVGRRRVFHAVVYLEENPFLRRAWGFDMNVERIPDEEDREGQQRYRIDSEDADLWP